MELYKVIENQQKLIEMLLDQNKELINLLSQYTEIEKYEEDLKKITG